MWFGEMYPFPAYFSKEDNFSINPYGEKYLKNQAKWNWQVNPSSTGIPQTPESLMD